MRRGTAIGLIPIALFWAATGLAQDFDRYIELTEAAEAAHNMLEDGSPDLLPALRENAVERDFAVIDWLDDFMATEAFGDLATNQQTLASQDRFRYEYNASRLLIELDRCEEARDRIRSLLDSAVEDEELRPRLTETYESALECMTRDRVAHISVDVTPPNSQVIVDGTFLGMSNISHPVAIGEHTLTVSADGYYGYDEPFSVDTEGETIELGPIVLEEMPPPESYSPEWYHWTMWGVGAAGVGTGIVMFLQARSREDDIENPPPGQIVVDATAEQEVVDELDLIAYLTGGVGIASAITGTILYIVGAPDDDDETGGTVSWGAHFNPIFPGVNLHFTF